MHTISVGVRRSLAGGAVLALCLMGLAACSDKAAKTPPGAAGVTATAVPAVAPPAAAASAPAATPSPAVADATLASAAPPDTDNPADDGGAVDIGSVTIAADPGANGGATTEVDFVVAFDPAAAQEIAGLSAAAWFEKRGTYTVNDRAQVMSWLVAPGANVAETPVDLDGAPKAAFVFARYKSPGDHRQKIAGEGGLSITLGPKDFTADVAQ